MTLFSSLIYSLPMISIILLIKQQSHFLMTLMSLECITLGLLMFTNYSSYITGTYLPHMSIMVLTLGVCEASFGLTLMVSMMRSKGSDRLKTMTMIKC